MVHEKDLIKDKFIDLFIVTPSDKNSLKKITQQSQGNHSSTSKKEKHFTKGSKKMKHENWTID